MACVIKFKAIKNVCPANGLQGIEISDGHGPFFADLETMRLANTRICQCCLSGEETAEHFIGVCPEYELIRFEVFGTGQINAKDFGALRMEPMLKFVKKTRRLQC